MANIYQKIQKAKDIILHSNLKKSGKNSFAGYEYFELSDLLPTIIKVCNELNLFTKIDFTDELATLQIVNIDKPEEVITYTSPMKELSLKGANAIQALGGAETYQRRYLYMTAFDIIEADLFDGADPKVIAPKSKIEILNDAISKYAKRVNQDEATVKKFLMEKIGAKSVKDLDDAKIDLLISKIS